MPRAPATHGEHRRQRKDHDAALPALRILGGGRAGGRVALARHDGRQKAVAVIRRPRRPRREGRRVRPAPGGGARTGNGLRPLVGGGIPCSDHWSASDHVELLKRQVCWVHLKRNGERMLQRGGKAKIVAESCLSVQERVFDLWYLCRGGRCSRAQLDEGMAPWLLHLLGVRQGACVVGIARPSASARVCWGFTRRCGRPWSWKASNRPTTTSSAQRQAVLWRRRSFGCQSAAN